MDKSIQPPSPEGAATRLKPGGGVFSSAMFECNGKTYELVPIEPAELLGAVEQYLQERRKKPLRAVLEALEDVKNHPLVGRIEKTLIDRAYADLVDQEPVSNEKLMAWLNSIDGLTWVLGYSLKKRYPELTDDDIKKMWVHKSVDKLKELADKVGQATIEAATAATTTAPEPEAA